MKNRKQTLMVVNRKQRSAVGKNRKKYVQTQKERSAALSLKDKV
jgi:hypothetical protein